MEELKMLRCDYDISLKDGECGAYCECGKVLHCKEPKIKGLYQITCPNCGFKVSLLCGKNKMKVLVTEMPKDEISCCFKGQCWDKNLESYILGCTLDDNYICSLCDGLCPHLQTI